MSTTEGFIRKIENAKALDFGSIFNQCIALFKKVWLQGLLVVILNGVLIFPLVFIMYIPMILLGVFSPESFGQNQDFSNVDSAGMVVIIVSIFLFLVVVILCVSLSVALKAAYFRIVRSRDLNENASNDYFFFLKRNYLKKTIKLSLIMAGISLVSLLLFILPLFYVLIPLSYMIVIYAMNPDLEVLDIFKMGFKLGNKKWWITFGLIIVSGILAQLAGMLLCFVGVLITASFRYLPLYFIYKETIGLDETHEIDFIGDAAS